MGMDARVAALCERIDRLGSWLADERHSRTATGLWAAAVVGLALLVYVPQLSTKPDGYDETVYLYMLAPLTTKTAGAWCIWPYETFPYFRPLGFASLILDRLVWGRPQARYLPNGEIDQQDLLRLGHDPVAAFPYRLTNLFVYLAGCLAFGLMAGQIARSRAFGAIAGPVYALAPQNRITVLYYPERFILLVALFSFLSIACFFRQLSVPTARWRYGAASVALFACALASKEHAIVLPVLLVLWTLLLAPKSQWRKAVVPLLAMALVLVAYLAVRHHVLGFFFRGDVGGAAALPRFRTLPVRFMIGPALNSFAGLRSLPLSPWVALTPNFWSALLGLAVFWGTAYLLIRRQWRLLAAIVVWMAVMYAPIAHAYAFDLFPYKLYLPNATGPLMAALALWQWGALATEHKWRTGLPLLVVVGYAVTTWIGRR